MTLPVFFAIAMGLAALFGVFAMWQSLRATFQAGHIRDLPSLDTGEAHRALEDEKQALLGNIRDLRFEHEAGKIAADDFERQDERLRARAREVLRLLDEDIDAYVRRAEKLITESLGPDASSPYRTAESEPVDTDEVASEHKCAGCATPNEPDAEFCKKCGRGLKAHVCSGCETTNDVDAEFCKKCGRGLSTSEPDSGDDDADDSSEKSSGADEPDSGDDADDSSEKSNAEEEPS
ncbi:MAG: zinc ribbon domain-containing protein [Deltaproteobacteria bacterium]|nr:zinc ribbon domain-containing protein [Deltaproteobacteria bacterium]